MSSSVCLDYVLQYVLYFRCYGPACFACSIGYVVGGVENDGLCHLLSCGNTAVGRVGRGAVACLLLFLLACSLVYKKIKRKVWEVYRVQ